MPSVHDSAERFLDWCAPLLTADELTETRDAVAAFIEPDSPIHQLQAILAQRAEVTDSWLDEFWAARYLGRRDRIPLNANFCFLLPDTGEDQLHRAAGLIAGLVAAKLAIDAARWPAGHRRGVPLSMQQYRFLFSSTRIPGVVRDTATGPYTDTSPGPSTSRHIVVFTAGRAYRLEVVDPDGLPHHPAAIVDALAALRAEAMSTRESRSGRDAPAVGALGTADRADWAADRSHLIDLHPANVAAVDSIDSALFCLALDQDEPIDEHAAADLLLHGNGNSENRWYDKTLTVIVFANGSAGLNAEHCRLDGTTVVELIDGLAAATIGHAPAGSGAEPPATPVSEPIDFVLDEHLRQRIQLTDTAFRAAVADASSLAVDLPGVGSDAAKAMGLSPDAFYQMAFQLADHRLRGTLGSTYESVSTRTHRHGRTEAMRVVTPEVVDLLDTFDDTYPFDETADGSADRQRRRAALQAAVDAHVRRARQCQRGEAPEQHLWELQLLQQHHGQRLGVAEQPALYDSPGWRILRDDHLSTSALNSPNVRYFGFGPTGDHCIGIGYRSGPDGLWLYLSAGGALGEQLGQFAAELSVVLTELVRLHDTDPQRPVGHRGSDAADSVATGGGREVADNKVDDVWSMTAGLPADPQDRIS